MSKSKFIGDDDEAKAIIRMMNSASHTDLDDGKVTADPEGFSDDAPADDPEESPNPKKP